MTSDRIRAADSEPVHNHTLAPMLETEARQIQERERERYLWMGDRPGDITNGPLMDGYDWCDFCGKYRMESHMRHVPGTENLICITCQVEARDRALAVARIARMAEAGMLQLPSGGAHGR